MLFLWRADSLGDERVCSFLFCLFRFCSAEDGAPAFYDKLDHKNAGHYGKAEGTPNLAHSLLFIESLPAQMMLGMLLGMSIPPAIRRPSNSSFIVSSGMAGVISAAVKVALSKRPIRYLSNKAHGQRH